MTVIPTLTTRRLVLREFVIDDLSRLVAMYSDQETMQFLGGAQSRYQIEIFYPIRLQRWQDHGWGAWAVELSDKPELVGVVGFGPPRAPFENATDCLDLGWLLDKSLWGQGLASEAAKVALDWGFNNVEIGRVSADPDTRNVTSCRICEKLGMSVVTNLQGKTIYQITRRTWSKSVD